MGSEDNSVSANESGIDTKRLSSAIIELNISRKNITLYPIEHPVIEKAIRRAYEILQELFQAKDNISIGISKDTLIVDQNYLDKKNTVYRDFARAMNKKNISSVTFKSDLSIKDLNGFLVVTSLADDEIKARGGIVKAIEDEGITGIVVTMIDYSSFKLTSEDKITQKNSLEEVGTEGLWDSFVYRMMGGSGGGAGEGEGAGKDKMIKVSSKKLAKMISETKYKQKAEEQSYDEVITDYIREANKKTGGDDTKRKKLIRDVADFTNELSPDLRKQLLRSTFNDENEELEGMEDFVADLSSDVILETLEDVNEKKLSVPTTILNLLEKFAGVDKNIKIDETTYREIENSRDIDIKENVNELLFEDHQNDFTPEDYQVSIDRFVKAKNAQIFKEKYPERYKEFSDSFKDEFIDFRYIILLIEIAKKEKDSGELKKLLDSLNETCILFIETGQYSSAKTVLDFFAWVADAEGLPQGANEAARSKIDDFKEKKITDEMISGLKQWGKERFDEIKDILVLFQDITIKPLLKELSLEESSHNRKLYINVISAMDKRVGYELVRHLDHKKWYFVRNMVFLLREIKADEYIEEIKRCYAHENNMVKIEVLKTLLSLHSKVGLDVLKSAIESDDKSFSNSCILLAGSYKITDLFTYLIARLKKKGIMTRSLLNEKKVLVKALSEMGDNRVLPYFKDILLKNTFIFRSNFNELKASICKGLKRFDPEDIEELVNIGLKSSNKDIQNVCRQLH